MADEQTTDIPATEGTPAADVTEPTVAAEAPTPAVTAPAATADVAASTGGTVLTAEPTLVAMGRKVREGLVASNKMDKTAIVVTQDRVRHRRYNKTVQRDKRLYVHDEKNELSIGDRVRVIETRPLSKNKRWRLLEILERAR